MFGTCSVRTILQVFVLGLGELHSSPRLYFNLDQLFTPILLMKCCERELGYGRVVVLELYLPMCTQYTLIETENIALQEGSIMQLTTTLPIRSSRIAIGAIFFLAGLTFASWASRIPDVKTALELNEARLGLILFALPIGQMVSLPVAAWMISKAGSKSVVITAALLYPFTLTLASLAPTSYVLAIGLLLFGFFANLLNIAMNTQAVGVELLYGRSIMGSFHGLWSLGGFSGAILGGLFVSMDVPPTVHFSLIFLLSGLIVLGGHRFTLAEGPKAGVGQRLFTKPDKYILVLGLIAFFCMVCEGALADWSGVYFQKVVRAPEQLTTIGYIAFTSTMAGGRFLGDGLVTRYGVKNVLRFSGALIAGGLLVAILWPGVTSATAGFLLVGFGVSSVVPTAYGLAGRSKTMLASTALAAVSSISFLGFLVGPPVIGFIAQASSLRLSFALVALLGLGTAFFAGKIKSNDS